MRWVLLSYPTFAEYREVERKVISCATVYIDFHEVLSVIWLRNERKPSIAEPEIMTRLHDDDEVFVVLDSNGDPTSSSYSKERVHRSFKSLVTGKIISPKSAMVRVRQSDSGSPFFALRKSTGRFRDVW